MAEKVKSVGFSIQVVFVDGRTEQHEFAQEQATIGSSTEADLCIPLDELSPKHMLIVAREKGCWISIARGVETPVLYMGRYVDSQEVPYGAELDVGTITLRIGESVELVRAREEGQRSLLRIVALACVAILAFYMLKKDVIPVPTTPAKAPELFDGVSECTAKPAEMLQRAFDLEAAATAYWQRYPFDAQEGIRASRLYLEAVECFKGGGEKAYAIEIANLEKEIATQINRDYQTVRLQLSRSLKDGDYKLCKNLVVRLSNYLQHRPGEYLDWVGRVSTYLRSR